MVVPRRIDVKVAVHVAILEHHIRCGDGNRRCPAGVVYIRVAHDVDLDVLHDPVRLLIAPSLLRRTKGTDLAKDFFQLTSANFRTRVRA
jgi:hypothetical protein